MPPAFMTDDGGVSEKTSGGVPAGGDEPPEDNLNFKGMKKKKKPAINLDELGQVEPVADAQSKGQSKFLLFSLKFSQGFGRL